MIGWAQVHTWRLARQFVDPRGHASAVEIVSRLCGVQAQVASAAGLGVRLRQAEPSKDTVEQGVTDRVIVKTWAMRGALHLLRASEAPSFLSVMASARTWEKPSWQRAFGATPKQVDALADLVMELLADTVLTRDELVTAIVARKEFAAMEEQLRSGWGALLKPLAWRGALCHGPNRGKNVTFTRPDTLLPEWKGMPSADEAAPAVIAAYLGAYGPSTPDAFDAWLLRGGLKKATLRGWFAAMGDRLTTVDVEGQQAYILTEHADDLASASSGTAVRLLGAFDQYVLGPGTRDPHILSAEHRALVSRAAGWISPIVVVAGRICGVWELTDDQVNVSFFPGATKPDVEDLEAEILHLARATGRDQLTLNVA